MDFHWSSLPAVITLSELKSKALINERKGYNSQDNFLSFFVMEALNGYRQIKG